MKKIYGVENNGKYVVCGEMNEFADDVTHDPNNPDCQCADCVGTGKKKKKGKKSKAVVQPPAGECGPTNSKKKK